MKCKQCGAELKDGAMFCVFCGAKQSGNAGAPRFCTGCGAPLGNGMSFCTVCGKPVPGAGTAAAAEGGASAAGTASETAGNAAPEAARGGESYAAANSYAAQQVMYGQGGIPAGAPQKKKKSKAAFIIIAVVVLAALAGGALWYHAEKTPDLPRIPDGAAAADKQVDEVETDAIESYDADMIADGTVSLNGQVKVSTDGKLFLEWDKPVSILLKQDDGSFVQMEGISAVYMDNDGVDGDLWGALPVKEEVRAAGELYLDGSTLHMAVTSLTTADGFAIVQSPEEAQTSAQTYVDDDQILPQSAERLLTNADIKYLSLQEINYAKNEIYARHGRKFLSKELQTYFNSCWWYVGTVEAADFKESWLTDIEKKNANFLAAAEFSIAPKGYQLDQ